MAKRYRVKCPLCNEFFYREDEPFVEYKNRYYHKECFEKGFDQKAVKEEQDKKALEEFIKKLFNIEKITPLIRTQIKNYHDKEDYKFTYSGMQGALEYFFIVCKGDVTKSHGIGIIPYIYEEAKNYYYGLQAIEEKNKDIHITNEVQDIIIATPKRVPLRKVKTIELDIEEGEDYE